MSEKWEKRTDLQSKEGGKEEPKIIDNQPMYRGKDGKEYSTPEDLAEADRIYIESMNPKIEKRNL